MRAVEHFVLTWIHHSPEGDRKMLSPAGEGILTDFCASLFRFQGAAARHCRSWLRDPGVVRQGADRADTRPRDPDHSGLALLEPSGRPCQSSAGAAQKRWAPCGGVGTVGDRTRVGQAGAERFLACDSRCTLLRWDEPINDRAKPSMTICRRWAVRPTFAPKGSGSVAPSST